MVKEAEGLKYHVRNGFDEWMAWDIVGKKVYEVPEPTHANLLKFDFHIDPVTRALLAKPSAYREGDLFVDIGAYAGVWSAFMGVAYRNSRGVAIDPIPENCSLVSEQFTLNELSSRFRVVQAAVGYGAGVDISYGGGDSQFMAYEVHESVVGRVVHATIWTLNDILRHCWDWFQSHRVYILKIDCEGGEYGFFESAGVAELQHCCWIVGEYHHGWERFHPKLVQSGFEVLHGPWENVALFKYFNPHWEAMHAERPTF